jgi:hypothetical protein
MKARWISISSPALMIIQRGRECGGDAMRTIKLAQSELLTPFMHRVIAGAVVFLVAASLFAAHAAAADLIVIKVGTGSGTVTSNPAGISCGNDCTETYTSDTVVTLTATPAAGSDFSGWAEDCSGTAACTVTMSANRSVRAVFNLSSAGGPITQIVCEFATGDFAGQIAVITVSPTSAPAVGQACSHPQGSALGSGAIIMVHTSLFQFVCKFNTGPLAGQIKVLTAATAPSIGAACSEGDNSGTVVWNG